MRRNSSRGPLVLLLAAIVAGCGGGPQTTAQSRLSSASAERPSPPGSIDPGSGVSPSASPRVSVSPTPQSSLVPLVPIVSFWSTERSISKADLANLLGGRAAAGKERRVAVSTDDLPALGSSLGVTPAAQPLAPADVRAFVRKTPGALGIVRAEDVTMDVRALAVDGVRLFGIERSPVAKWPLLVPETGAASTFAARAEWTLAAGGDVMLDRGAYAQAILKGKGTNYPWDGGTAAIDGRTCCGWGSGGRAPLVKAHRTGNAGAVRNLLQDADLALVNLEAPVSDSFVYHSSGFTFSADPRMLDGLKRAGIDGVSLANNHLGNAGTQGVLDTLRYLDALGIGHTGAGTGQTAARKPAWFEAAGRKIAFLAYDDIDPTSYWARAGHPGSAAFDMDAIRADIKAARTAGADVVIVMPHWGYEYTYNLYPYQRPDAKAMIAAGADIVLASHSHWFGQIEAIDPEHVAFYSLGNFVFDWTHDEKTQEGALVDLTFVGSKLVQFELHPTVILDGAQPNLLDPATDGNQVLAGMRQASEPLLGW